MTCVHVWQIATADGPTSLGVCSQCAAERSFQNATPLHERATTPAKRKESNEVAEGRKAWDHTTMGVPFSVEP